MASLSPFHLKVQKIEQVCLFELSWGKGQQLTATLTYPSSLTELFHEWQRVYLGFYKTAQMPSSPIATPAKNGLRGRVIAGFNLGSSNIDWHARLVEAETKLLNEFHRWLRSAELFEIRAAIAHASRAVAEADRHIDVFLTCTPIELARFPWEAWEIGTDFAVTGTIRIVRTPTNIRADIGSQPLKKRRGRARILAIFGDDTGLDFRIDRAAVRSLSRVTDVKFVGWQPGQSPADVKEQIRQAIADEAGWDVLFFAGHSNETQVTSGELAIAPGASIQISEIASQLTAARRRGLQFAIFNSCSGLSIAESLISLGFSQVAVMREPIHNRVAQEFLVRFLQSLAEYHDVQESLLAACQFLRLEKNLTYPSAYLVPSLFCHPGATLFRITPYGWKQRLYRVLPTRLEAGVLAGCLALSLIPPVQNVLLDWRVWGQAVYRNLTGQLPPVGLPPVALVQIDEASIERDSRIAAPNPMDQSYLADVIDRLSKLNAPVIGIDYLLNRPDPKPGNNTQRLRESIRQAVAQHHVWFVFSTLADSFEAEGLFTTEVAGIAERNWSVQGYMEAFDNRLMLPDPAENCQQICPFAYLLSLIYAAHQTGSTNLPQPDLKHQTDLRTQLLEFASQSNRQRLPSPNGKLALLQRSRLSPISDWSYQMFGVPWFQPIIDFSIPPDRVYSRISAWRLFDRQFTLAQLPQQIVLIAAGGYPEAGGLVVDQPDYGAIPTAIGYWRKQLPPGNNAATFPMAGSANTPTYLSVFTGGEVHAYTVHHLLTQRFVVPIPDAWMVCIAGLLGKGIVVLLRRQPKWTRERRKQYVLGLAGTTVCYGLVSLQLYVSAAVLLPWVLPLSTFWLYVLPSLKAKSNA